MWPAEYARSLHNSRMHPISDGIGQRWAGRFHPVSSLVPGLNSGRPRRPPPLAPDGRPPFNPSSKPVERDARCENGQPNQGAQPGVSNARVHEIYGSRAEHDRHEWVKRDAEGHLPAGLTPTEDEQREAHQCHEHPEGRCRVLHHRREAIARGGAEADEAERDNRLYDDCIRRRAATLIDLTEGTQQRKIPPKGKYGACAREHGAIQRAQCRDTDDDGDRNDTERAQIRLSPAQ